MIEKTPATIARDILDAATRLGWTLEIRGHILTAKKRFTPGDRDGFVEADMTYYEVIGLLPRTSPGNDWGTDGGSAGAIAAIENGVFIINRSGGSKQVLKALAKIL
jgi:hypothetical protein